nr:immunoglobulin light chain junction region [Macaca mulatta]MOV77756.1 immunoglobulin light chain junction region [Macaca mulatta]MOV77959.1 immunoglobulin light chain junction region [Macaca mulatta]MOV78065.1 immunoglobulin light chain junction region [Macaca mulatta]MOV78158.1 immunoglobulin light chain junction region [Macaca mulatta]
CEQYNSLPYTF